MAALEHDSQKRTIEEIERGIAEGRLILLSGAQSAMVLDVIEIRALHISLAGGNLEELKTSYPQMVEMARVFGCTQITAMGRKGWERAMREFGYEALLMKEVPNGKAASS